MENCESFKGFGFIYIYIYIDYVFLNPTIKGCSPFGYGK